MALPTLPKKSAANKTVTIRLSTSGINALKTLAKNHNMTQTMVIEALLEQEINRVKTEKAEQPNKRT